MKVEFHSYDSKIKNFTFHFILKTEGISYFIMVPILLIFFIATLSFSHQQFIVFLLCVSFAFPISFVTTQINNIIVTKPVQKYFNTLVKNEDIPDQLYDSAFKRFLSLPYLHSLGAFFRWVVGLSLAGIPLTLSQLFNFTQLFTFWASIAITAPSGAIFYFLLTEHFIQDIYNLGVFPKIPSDFSFSHRMNITKKLMISISIIVFTPFIILTDLIVTIINTNSGEISNIWWKIFLFGAIGLFYSLLLAKLLAKSIISKTTIIKEFLSNVGRGNLSAYTRKIAVADELADINIAVYNMKENLRKMVEIIYLSATDLKETSNNMKLTSAKFSEASRDLSAIIEETSSAYEEMSSSFEMILNSIKAQVEHARTVNTDILSINESSTNLSKQIDELVSTFSQAIAGVEKGQETMQRSVTAITDISRYLENVESTVSAINEIADKINLLALNAAIEAARAGEHGRGFAVVADEVNKLADQTASLVKGIQSTIEQYTHKIKTEINYISQTSALFETVRQKVINTEEILKKTQEFNQHLNNQNTGIQDKISRLVNLANEIYTTSKEQQITIEELTKAINSINDVASHTAEETTTIQLISEKLAENAATLIENITFFKVSAE